MADKRVDQLDALSSDNFTDDDLLVVFDSDTGQTRRATIETVSKISGTKGGFTFTGGFAKRSDPIRIGQDDVDKWVPLDFSDVKQQNVDLPWWPGAAPSNGIDLFGGSALPHGVSRMIQFDLNALAVPVWNTSVDTDVSDSQGAVRPGTFVFDELETGTTNLVRVDLNITPQIANTTIEVGLWFQPKQSLHGQNDGGAFPLPGSPLFFGTGTVGRSFLSRPTSTMYIASDSDRYAYAVPVVKSDNPVTIEPISVLLQNLR